jgi:threonine dehydrogenase-like Zn-dependent dehydrogenase
MRALVWQCTQDIRCVTVLAPKIEDEQDAIIKGTTCSICGSEAMRPWTLTNASGWKDS